MMGHKFIISVFLVFIYFYCIGQKDSSYAHIKGTLLDSGTNEPIPFANVGLGNAEGVVFDDVVTGMEGEFQIKVNKVSFLEIEDNWHEKKVIKESSFEKPLVIKLKKTYEKAFIIDSKSI